jgi:hypothetical protein
MEPGFRYGGRSVRVVNGAGEGLTVVQGRYKEPITIPQPDLVICAGAIDLGVPGKLVSPGRGSSIMRPAPGGGAKWLTFDQALVELSI